MNIYNLRQGDFANNVKFSLKTEAMASIIVVVSGLNKISLGCYNKKGNLCDNCKTVLIK